MIHAISAHIEYYLALAIQLGCYVLYGIIIAVAIVTRDDLRRNKYYPLQQAVAQLRRTITEYSQPTKETNT